MRVYFGDPSIEILSQFCSIIELGYCYLLGHDGRIFFSGHRLLPYWMIPIEHDEHDDGDRPNIDSFGVCVFAEDFGCHEEEGTAFDDG